MKHNRPAPGNPASTSSSKKDRWKVGVLELEIRQLMREQDHLRGKSVERGLTAWENERVTALATEIIERVAQLASVH